MRINGHAGHNPDCKIGCGAIGLIKESTEARKVNKYVIKHLKKAKHTVKDCTVSNGKSVSDILDKIVTMCNQDTADIDYSIHFNCGRGDKKGDNSIGGTEVLIYTDKNEELLKIAKNVADSISKCGYKLRCDSTTPKGYDGVKIRKDLYFLKHTKAPAMLIECCFVDDKDDIEIYNAKKMAQAITVGILNSFDIIEYTTKKKCKVYNSKGKKLGTIKKNTTCNIDKVKFIDNKLYGRRKKHKHWILLKNLKVDNGQL